MYEFVLIGSNLYIIPVIAVLILIFTNITHISIRNKYLPLLSIALGLIFGVILGVGTIAEKLISGFISGLSISFALIKKPEVFDSVSNLNPNKPIEEKKINESSNPKTD